MLENYRPRVEKGAIRALRKASGPRFHYLLGPTIGIVSSIVDRRGKFPGTKRRLSYIGRLSSFFSLEIFLI